MPSASSSTETATSQPSRKRFADQRAETISLSSIHAQDTKYLIVGTAGHVDHGKTSLIQTLTGIDTDRLPEEKRRGLTIDLGFAWLRMTISREPEPGPGPELQLGIVDVPGHERFVSNMLAGAMGMDAAILVVAANESVQPQTSEHLDILQHAGIKHGLIVLTKCDLVESDWIDLVEQEVLEAVSPTFLRDAAIIRASSTTGAGLDSLRASLAQVCQLAVAERERRATSKYSPCDLGPFILGIDRAFTVAGHGTVVTGSVTSGRLKIGDSVVLEPGGQAARVRGLQSCQESVQQVERGQRAAINLAGVNFRQIARGQVLAQPGWLTAKSCIAGIVHLANPCNSHSLEQARERAGRTAAVRIHLGTAEVEARLRWLEPASHGSDSDSEARVAEFSLSAPAACLPGQPFVFRDRSGSQTLGGGRVLDPDLPPNRRWSPQDLVMLRKLGAPEPLQRCEAALYCSREQGFDECSFRHRMGTMAPTRSLLDQLVVKGVAVPLYVDSNPCHWLHRDVLDKLTGRVTGMLSKLHQASPLAAGFPLSALYPIFGPFDIAKLDEAVAEHMQQQGGLIISRKSGREICLSLPVYRPRLTRLQLRQYRRILEIHCRAVYSPPSCDALPAIISADRSRTHELIELALVRGKLTRTANDRCLWSKHLQRLPAMIEEWFQSKPFTVSQFGEKLNCSRKFTVPLVEYLDRVGWTTRDGQTRSLSKSLDPRTGSLKQGGLQKDTKRE
jgi:selenocysteine-specific elongation factor